MIRDAHLPAVIAAAILMTGCAPPPAASEPQAQVLAVDQVAGFWRLSAPDGKACDLALGNLVIDGVHPVLVENCRTPEVQPAKSWRATRDGVQLLTASGAVVMAFRRTGEDSFEATDPRYRLTRAPLF